MRHLANAFEIVYNANLKINTITVILLTAISLSLTGFKFKFYIHNKKNLCNIFSLFIISLTISFA